MRIALILWTLGVASSLEVNAGEAKALAESSFIIGLADNAIDAEGAEAVANRETFRRVFADWFLISFAKLEGDMGPNAETLSSRIMYRGGQAGHAYRIANPDSVQRVMVEYGYEKYEVVGEYVVKLFGFNYFVPENEIVRPFRTTPFACWHLNVVQSPELTTQMQRLFSAEEYRAGSRKYVRVMGFLGPLRKVVPGEDSLVVVDGFECERILYATSISEMARESE